MKTKIKMKIKELTKNKKQNKVMNILIISAIVLAIAFLAVAQTNEELEQEVNNLIQELEGAGYSWLINYSGIVDNVFYGIINKIFEVKNGKY